MPRLLLLQNGRAETLAQRSFLKEADLRRRLEENPELIALDDVDPTAAPLLPIGRDVHLDGRALDLLFIDTIGRLTAVEVKLWQNPEIRRTVVGQVLEYGAYLAEWEVEDAERQAESYFKGPDVRERFKSTGGFYEAMSKLSTEEADEEAGPEDRDAEEWTRAAFREMIADNLLRRDFRLLIAVDQIIDPLRRTVTFLNATSHFGMYLLEVQEYPGPEKIKIASISVYGAPPKPPVGVREDLEKQFREALETIEDAAIRAVAKQLLEFIEEEADSVVWGKHAHFDLRRRAGRFAVFYLTKHGKVYVTKGRLRKNLPDHCDAFLDALRQIDVDEGPDFIWVYPHVLTNPSNLERFKLAVRSLQGAALT